MAQDQDPLPNWREGPTKRSVVRFVAAVTDPKSDEMVPEVDRVAVFDSDGTPWAEMPMYAQLAFALDRAAILGHPTTPQELAAGGIGAVRELVKLTHGKVTTDEFEAACRKWKSSARPPAYR